MNSLKNRIYLQNGIIILTLILILESIFILFISKYYNNGAKRELQNKLYLSSTLYNKYLSDQNINEKIRYILENEAKNQAFYTELLDKNFTLLIDSNGFSNNKKSLKYPDLVLASKNSSTIMKYKGKETLLAMTVPLYDKENNVWAYLRYSTCINKIEKTLINIIELSILIISFVLIITFLFSSILANKIVNPIEKLILASQKMAKGDFSHKIIINNKDEIGKLAATLNYMSGEINKSNTLKNEFISSISHELRTPLTAIKGWSELILTNELKDTEDLKEGVSVISSETERLIVLVEDLLDFSKLESGRINLNLEEVNLNQIIKDISYYFSSKLNQKNLTLHLNIDNEPIIITGDKNRLKQVFVNLLHNSIKFTDLGKNIYVDLSKFNNMALLNIKDEGIGISQKDLNRITEKFFKGSSKSAGSGIGLAICKEIVSLHKGTMTIKSIENIGTTVSLILPLKY